MIWNYIYEFYLMYIFGGRLNGEYFNGWVDGLAYNGEYFDDFNGTGTMFINLDFTGYDFLQGSAFNQMCLGNYLSLIATIITMSLIVFFAIWLVRWVFKVVASAMLLK